MNIEYFVYIMTHLALGSVAVIRTGFVRDVVDIARLHEISFKRPSCR